MSAGSQPKTADAQPYGAAADEDDLFACATECCNFGDQPPKTRFSQGCAVQGDHVGPDLDHNPVRRLQTVAGGLPALWPVAGRAPVPVLDEVDMTGGGGAWVMFFIMLSLSQADC